MTHGGGRTFSQNVSFYSLGWTGGLNELMNYKVVHRTAPATLGLLNRPWDLVVQDQLQKQDLNNSGQYCSIFDHIGPYCTNLDLFGPVFN